MYRARQKYNQLHPKPKEYNGFLEERGVPSQKRKATYTKHRGMGIKHLWSPGEVGEKAQKCFPEGLVFEQSHRVNRKSQKEQKGDLGLIPLC